MASLAASACRVARGPCAQHFRAPVGRRQAHWLSAWYPFATPLCVKDPWVDADGVFKRTKSADLAERYTNTIRMEDEVIVQNEVLGMGMSGAVRLGTWRDSGASCAVKSFVKEDASSFMRENVKNEVETYMSLEHPKVARLERVFETETRIHLVMEHLQGGQLCEAAKKRMLREDLEALPSSDAANAVRQVLEALSYLHDRGVAHLDVKLSNVCRESVLDSSLKLIDFGCAANFGRQQLNRVVGTREYMAPEVVDKEVPYTEKADLWSVGILSLQLLSGRPRWGELLQEGLRADAGSLWQSLVQPLDAEAKDFVSSLLVVNPQKRFSAAEALEHPWIQSLEF